MYLVRTITAITSKASTSRSSQIWIQSAYFIPPSTITARGTG